MSEAWKKLMEWLRRKLRDRELKKRDERDRRMGRDR